MTNKPNSLQNNFSILHFLCLMVILIVILSACSQELTSQSDGSTVLILSEPSIKLQKVNNKAIKQVEISTAIPELTSLEVKLVDDKNNLINELELLNSENSLQLEVTPGEALKLNAIAYAGDEILYNGNVDILPLIQGESRTVSLTLTPTVNFSLKIPTDGQDADNPNQASKLPVGKSQSLKIDNTLQGLTDNSIIWFVNNIEGGNDAVGTISTDGIYTPPEQLPDTPEITIKATPQKAPSFSTEVTIVLAQETTPILTVESIQVQNPISALSLDQTHQLILETVLSDQSIASISEGENINWSSDNASFVSVDDNGLLTALQLGSARITANAFDKQTSLTVSVSGTEPQLTAIQINNPPNELRIDATAQLQVDALYDNQSVINIDNDESISWSSDDENILIVSASGFLTAKQPGSAVITVKTLDKQDVITIKVINPINRIELINAPSELSMDMSVQLQLDAIYENNVRENITVDDAVIWTISNEAIVSIDSSGILNTVQTGTVDIIVNAFGKEAKHTLTISNPVTRIELVNPPQSLIVNSTSQLQLSAFFENGDIVDITNTESITWLSSDEQFVTVDDNGLLNALSTGTASITVNALGKEAKHTLTISNPVTRIELVNPPQSLIVNSTSQLQLNAIFENEDIVDITNTESITWLSSDEQVVTVDDNGLLEALSSGNASITVSALGETAILDLKIDETLTFALDTDGDGIGDAEEIELGFDPNNPNEPSLSDNLVLSSAISIPMSLLNTIKPTTITKFSKATILKEAISKPLSIINTVSPSILEQYQSQAKLVEALPIPVSILNSVLVPEFVSTQPNQNVTLTEAISKPVSVLNTVPPISLTENIPVKQLKNAVTVPVSILNTVSPLESIPEDPKIHEISSPIISIEVIE